MSVYHFGICTYYFRGDDMSTRKIRKGRKKFEKDPAITAEIIKERPISAVYPVIDNDLARDNAENDLTYADEQDL